MKPGIIKNLFIFIFFISSLSIYGQSGGAGNSVLFMNTYTYTTIKNFEVQEIVDYMNIFMESYYPDLPLHYSSKHSYMRNFYRHFYFKKSYGMDYSTYVNIDVIYKKPFFGFQQKYFIEISFVFGYFPTFEKGSFIELDVYSFILQTIHDYIDQFDEYVSNNSIVLIKSVNRL